MTRSSESQLTREDLWRMSRADLCAVLANGHPIDLGSLRGPFRGVSLGLGGFVERLTWKTFRKRFWRDEQTGEVVGHNERLLQRGLAPRPSRGATRRATP